jgi:hypothetical protein
MLVRLAHKVIAVSPRAMIQIIRVTTADDFNGQPWPPTGDGWAVVRRTDGFTVWRSIRLVQSNPPPADARPTIIGGTATAHEDRHGN